MFKYKSRADQNSSNKSAMRYTHSKKESIESPKKAPQKHNFRRKCKNEKEIMTKTQKNICYNQFTKNVKNLQSSESLRSLSKTLRSRDELQKADKSPNKAIENFSKYINPKKKCENKNIQIQPHNKYQNKSREAFAIKLKGKIGKGGCMPSYSPLKSVKSSKNFKAVKPKTPQNENDPHQKLYKRKASFQAFSKNPTKKSGRNTYQCLITREIKKYFQEKRNERKIIKQQRSEGRC